MAVSHPVKNMGVTGYHFPEVNNFCQITRIKFNAYLRGRDAWPYLLGLLPSCFALGYWSPTASKEPLWIAGYCLLLRCVSEVKRIKSLESSSKRLP